MKKYLMLILIGFTTNIVKAQSLTQIELSYKYQFDSIYKWRAPFAIDTIFVKTDSSFRIVLDNITLKDSAKLISVNFIKALEGTTPINNLSTTTFSLKEDEIQILLLKFKTAGTKLIEGVKADSVEKEFRIVLHRSEETKERKEKPLQEKVNDALIERAKELLNEESKKEKVGYFALVSKIAQLKTLVKNINKDSKDCKDCKNCKNCAIWRKKYTLKKYKEEKDKERVIDSVSITFVDGAIAKRGLLVVLKNGQTYRNMYAPISLTKLNDRYNDILLNEKETEEGIYFGDILTYIYSKRFCYPDDGTISLTAKNPIAFVENKITIRDVINIAVYTDLLSLLGRKANGIIQTSLSAKIITNTNNWKNKDITMWNFVNPYFSSSKFDSKFQQIDSSRLGKTVKDSVDRLYINQTAYLRAGIKLNLIKAGLWPNEEFQINIGTELVLTNADSIFKKDIVTINYYPEIFYKTNRMENFGLEAAIRLLIQVPSKSIEFYNSKPTVFINPHVTMYYYPFSDPDKRIYLRYNHFGEIGAGKSNYPQIQFGYKTNLFKKD